RERRRQTRRPPRWDDVALRDRPRRAGARTGHGRRRGAAPTPTDGAAAPGPRRPRRRRRGRPAGPPAGHRARPAARWRHRRAARRGAGRSQYLTALVLIGLVLAGGLRLRLTTPLVSAPYVRLTAAVMASFGVADVEVGDDEIVVRPGRYRATDLAVEPDASSA